MNTLFKISQQTSWQLTGKIINSLITILILSIITRSFGEQGTGIYTLALTYLSFFYLAADFGINAHLLPEIISNASIWQKLFGLRIIFSAVLMVVAATLIYFWPAATPAFITAVLMGLIAIFANGVFISSLAIFQSKLRFDLATISQVIGGLTSLGLIYTLTKLHFSVPGLILGQTGGWIVCALLSLLFVKTLFVRNFIKLTPLFDWHFILQTFKSVWPFSLTLVVNLIYFRADAFILSFYKGFAEVGIYNLAYQIFQSLLVFPSFIMNSLYPMLLEKKSQNINKFYRLLRYSILLMLGISIIGAILIWVFSPLVIKLITGEGNFLGSIKALQILALSFPAFFVSSILMWLLIIYKKYHTLLLIYLGGLVLNISLNLIYIPQFSYQAAAIITGVSEYAIVLVLLMVIFLSKLKKE